MLALATLVGQYNASLLTLNDTNYGHIALDSNSRILLAHGTSSIKIGDGTDLLDILVDDAARAGGEKGILPLAVRKDTVGTLVSADGDWTPLQVDANGRLRVDAEVSVTTGSDKVEDSGHSSGDTGCYCLGVRQDTLATDTSADGDYQSMKMDALGALWIHDRHAKAEDAAHTSGDFGYMFLAVRNDAGGPLAGTDGDYSALQTDAQGRLRTVAVIGRQGTEGDVGADEGTTGEVGSIGTAAYVDLVSISIAAGTTYFLQAVDACTDKLCDVRLVVDDNGSITKVIRKFLTPESIAGRQLVFPREVEVAGGATISLKLQAKRLRAGATDASGSGGINGYTE